MVPIDTTPTTPQRAGVVAALAAEDSSVRLRAALAAGSDPDPSLLDVLVERCALEPDFFVRDMLSWALMRLPRQVTLPRLRRELASERAQARRQALHTLSKIGEPSAYAWITREMLRAADEEIARTAWRVAVALAPQDERKALARELVTQLGRGDRHVQLSLSRALVDLGQAITPALEQAAGSCDPAVAAHARATALLLEDPEAGFDAAIDQARRAVALGPQRAAAADAAVAAPDLPEPFEATGSTRAGQGGGC